MLCDPWSRELSSRQRLAWRRVKSPDLCSLAYKMNACFLQDTNKVSRHHSNQPWNQEQSKFRWVWRHIAFNGGGVSGSCGSIVWRIFFHRYSSALQISTWKCHRQITGHPHKYSQIGSMVSRQLWSLNGSSTVDYGGQRLSVSHCRWRTHAKKIAI